MYLQQVELHPLPGPDLLAAHLLDGGQDAFGLAEVNHEVLRLHPLDDARHDVALAARKLLEHHLALGLAQPL